MILTEAEAKTKWCPFTRTPFMDSNLIAANRGLGIENSCLCIASDCMMWEWFERVAKMKNPQTEQEAGYRYSAKILKTDPGNPDGTPRYELCEQTGFCGLIGRGCGGAEQ